MHFTVINELFVKSMTDVLQFRKLMILITQDETEQYHAQSRINYVKIIKVGDFREERNE